MLGVFFQGEQQMHLIRDIVWYGTDSETLKLKKERKKGNISLKCWNKVNMTNNAFHVDPDQNPFQAITVFTERFRFYSHVHPNLLVVEG